MNAAAPSRANDPAFRDWIARANRLGASATDGAAYSRVHCDASERFGAEVEPILGAPPVMLIRRREAMSLKVLEWWSGLLDAERVTIEGADFALNGLDAGLIAELAVGFITGAAVEAPIDGNGWRCCSPISSTRPRRLRPAVTRCGARRWIATKPPCSAQSNATTAPSSNAPAMVPSPRSRSGSQAIAAAIDLRSTTRDLGLDGRTGIHLGEVEQRDDDIGGIAVHLAARVMGEASPGTIVVSSAVEETTLGGRYQFGDLGTRGLKGIERPIHLFTVEPNAAR